MVRGETKMEREILVKNIDKKVFGREEILEAAYKENSDFKATSFRNLMARLLDSKTIVRVGRNRYINKNLKSYENHYSEEVSEIISEVEIKFPLLNFQVWELSWLNEFFNHLIAKNIVFLEVENSGCEFVYSFLSETRKSGVLLRPSQKELEYYSFDGTVVIDRLISETPKKRINSHHVAIEKIIVDLFADKNVKSILSVDDYPEAVERMFEKYAVDRSKLFRYAGRRNKSEEITAFLKNNTSVDLLTGV